MNFRNTLAAFIGMGFLLIIYTALPVIVGGLVLAAQILFWWLLGAGTLAGLYVAWLKWQTNRNQYLRSIDGQFPLHPVKLRDGRTVLVDPNKMISAAGIVDADGWAEVTPGAGWDHQTAVAKAVQNTRSLAALAPGDNAMIRTHGAIAQPRLPANVTKILQGREERPAAVVVQPSAPAGMPAIPADVHVPITGQQMIASTNPQPTRLAIGEDATTNALVQVDLALYPFLKLHGASGSGKTSLARLLVAQAIRRGYEVDIYDTRQFKDWGIFAQHARLIDSRDPKVLVAGLAEEVQRYKERDAELSRHGVPDLAALTTATGKAYRRRLVVIEEMGTQTLNARDEGKEVFVAYIRALRGVTVNARATGIHGIYLDQVPEQWDSTVRYNSTMICFYLPDHGGKKAGYPAACNLPLYHAYFEGKIVRTGHLSDGEIGQLIAATPVRTMEGAPQVRSGVNTPTNTPANTPMNTLANMPVNTPTNTPRTPPPSTPSEWEAFARVFFAGDPMASQRALTRAMAAVVDDGRPAEAFLGGLSTQLFHKCSPRGKKYEAPTQASKGEKRL